MSKEDKEVQALDNRIAMLVPDIDETLRTELQQLLGTLRNEGYVPGVIVGASRLVEGQRGLLERVASIHKYKLKGYNLEKQIEELREKGILPSEIASDLHWIRVRANRARHNIERLTLTVYNAETALNFVLGLIEWFYCKCEHDSSLPTIYTALPMPPEEDEREATVGLRFADMGDFFNDQEDKLAELRERLEDIEVFTGRAAALECLEAKVKKLQEGHGSVVFIAGETGIGKTTLVNHFINSVFSLPEPKPLIRVRHARIPMMNSEPFRPFKDLLFGWGQGPQSPQASEFMQGFDRLSQISPLLLFIDDLHWADESSISLIFDLSRHLAKMPILLIGTYRPHDIVDRPGYPAHPLSKVLLEMRRYDLCDTVFLERFTRDEIEDFLNRRYPNNRFPLSLARMLYEKTNGIPFFLEELVGLLIDQGNLFLDANNRWSARPLDTVPIPSRVLDVVQSRVQNNDKLDQNARLLLEYAPILGLQFRSSILAKILEPELSHRSVSRTLRTLEKHELVREKAGQFDALQPNWEFRHSFLHQALYDWLADDERIESHSLVVDTLESEFPSAREELAAELAHHCEAALRYEEAVTYRLIAAQGAYKTRSSSEQAFHCTQGILALKQLEPDSARLRDEVSLYAGLANAYRRLIELSKDKRVTKELRDMEEHMAKELHRLADLHDDPVAEIEGWFALLYIAEMEEDGDEVCRCTEQAWCAARRSQKVQNLIRVACTTGKNLYKLIPSQLKQRLDETIDFCRRKGATGLLATAIQRKAEIAYWENENDLAFSMFTEAIKDAELIGATDSSFQVVDEKFFSTMRTGPYWVVTRCVEYIGRIHRRRCEWQKAIKEFKRTYERFKTQEDLFGMAGLLNVIAETQLLACETEEAEQSFEQSWAIAQRTYSPELKGMVLSTGISIALEMENDAEAKTRLQLFEDVTRDWDAIWTYRGWIWHKRQMVRGILNMRAGKVNHAASFFLEGLKGAQKENEKGLIIEYSIHLAVLKLRNNNLDQALHYTDIALQSAKVHNRWEKGVALLISAQAKMQASRRSEAVELIEQAIKYFQKAYLLNL